MRVSFPPFDPELNFSLSHTITIHRWSLTLEVSLRIPHIGNVLANILRRTKLTSFSLMPLAPLPDDIPCLLSPQTDLDRFVFMAPSVLTSSSLGCWVASFKRLRA